MQVLCISAAWLFVASIIVQVFLAGLGLLVDGDQLELHRAFGYLIFICRL